MRLPIAGRGEHGTDRLVGFARRTGVTDERVLDAVATVPREEFVPDDYRDRAYEDGAIPIGEGQTTSQPSLIASMVAALGLEGGERVLEIGAGFGYQSALLGELCERVWAVEHLEALAERARANLERYGAANVEVVHGDGTEGLPDHAPYDAIILGAAHVDVPQPLVEQLREGGRLVQPVGPGGHERVTLFERTSEGLESVRTLHDARFVRLYGAHGFER